MQPGIFLDNGIQRSIVGYMTKTKLNFYCPSANVKIIDRMAALDHRDRTSMLNKIVTDYITANPIPEPSNGTKPTTKKAGQR